MPRNSSILCGLEQYLGNQTWFIPCISASIGVILYNLNRESAFKMNASKIVEQIEEVEKEFEIQKKVVYKQTGESAIVDVRESERVPLGQTHSIHDGSTKAHSEIPYSVQNSSQIELMNQIIRDAEKTRDEKIADYEYEFMKNQLKYHADTWQSHYLQYSLILVASMSISFRIIFN